MSVPCNMENKQKIMIENKENEEEKQEIPEPELITTITTNEQLTFSCVDYKINEESNYNLKFGDIQQWKLYSLSTNGKDIECEQHWFLKDQHNRKQRRRIFVEGKVNRIWNIDEDQETFNVKLHLFLSWLITKDEYLLINDEKYDDIWIPCVFIPNLIDGKHKFVDNGVGTKFKIVNYKKFAGFGNANIDIPKLNDKQQQFEIKQAKFIRCKLEISGSFRGDFKLKNFPFDLQDLTISIMDRSGRGTFLPAMRERKQFINVASQCFEIKEWDLRATMFEFIDANPMYDPQSFGKCLSQFIIKFKFERNYSMYLLKYIIIISAMTALSLLVFVFEHDSIGDRSGFIIGLVLTLAFTECNKPETDYMTILDKYITCNYFYLITMTVIVCLEPKIINKQYKHYDYYVMIIAVLTFIGYHLFWAIYAYYKHKQEYNKIFQTYSKDIQQMIDDDDDLLDKMRADYTKPLLHNMDSLTFIAKRENVLNQN